MEISELIRVGKITEINPKNMHCKVTFSDTHSKSLTTDWLPVLVTRAYQDMYYDLPDIGSSVVCLFLPNGEERGFILGSYYPNNAAPVQNADIYQHCFSDGSFVEYNRSTHKMSVSCVGDVDVLSKGTVNISGQAVNISASGVITLTASQIKAQE